MEAGAPAVEQRERLGGWGGHVATEEETEGLTRSNVAIRVAAERVRAADGNARAEKKRQKVNSGRILNPLTRCGGNKLIHAAHSSVHNPSYVMDGVPPNSGPYRSAEDLPDLSAWHSQDGTPGGFSQQQLEERLEGAAGGRPLELEVPQHAFHRPAPRELDSDGKLIGTDSLSTGWCYCSARVVRFYPVGCLLPLCCRASAVPNNGWLDAMAGDDRVYYCSD